MSIIIKDLCHVYNKSTPFETAALHNVSITINQGEFIGLIGHTGSGKSTFIQHINGLLKPTSGSIIIDGLDISQKGVSLKQLRCNVGLVFQYPEYQLFEDTVAKDIAFGPKNMGLTPEEISKRVLTALERVGLDHSILDKNPFDLSGGQKRRVAIAGVMAMEPKVLILDEPIAGLDPQGKNEILSLISAYHQNTNATIILVSHNMDDIAALASRVIVMNNGKIELDATPKEVFSQIDRMAALGLSVPDATLLCNELNKRGKNIPEDIITIKELADYITKIWRNKNA